MNTEELIARAIHKWEWGDQKGQLEPFHEVRQHFSSAAQAVQAALDAHGLVIGGGWQPMETAPKEIVCLFYIDWCDDCKLLNPPLTAQDRYALTKYGSWSALMEAIHWMPLPTPPITVHLKITGERVGG